MTLTLTSTCTPAVLYLHRKEQTALPFEERSDMEKPLSLQFRLLHRQLIGPDGYPEFPSVIGTWWWACVYSSGV